MYAERLKKEELIRDGISFDIIDNTLKVFRWGNEIEPMIIPNKSTEPYFGITIYKYDSEGNKLVSIDHSRKAWKECNICRTIGLHRAVYAWFHNEVPQGYVVDHKNNKHTSIEDYLPENLQLLTPAENLSKERGESKSEIKCKMNRPRSYYENKLNYYTAIYEEAKINKDADKAHKLRCNIAGTKARIRYWDSHKDEYIESVKKPKIDHEVVYMKKVIRQWNTANKNKSKDQWHRVINFLKNYKESEYDTLKQLFEIATNELN